MSPFGFKRLLEYARHRVRCVLGPIFQNAFVHRSKGASVEMTSHLEGKGEREGS
jgi:hypothetical protein